MKKIVIRTLVVITLLLLLLLVPVVQGEEPEFSSVPGPPKSETPNMEARYLWEITEVNEETAADTIVVTVNSGDPEVDGNYIIPKVLVDSSAFYEIQRAPFPHDAITAVWAIMPTEWVDEGVGEFQILESSTVAYKTPEGFRDIVPHNLTEGELPGDDDDPRECHFIINQIDGEPNKPPAIFLRTVFGDVYYVPLTVNEDGGSHSNTAHYSIYNFPHTRRDFTAGWTTIYDGWPDTGRFNNSHCPWESVTAIQLKSFGVQTTFLENVIAELIELWPW